MIHHDAARGCDPSVREGREQSLMPLRLRKPVVVDEGHHLAVAGGDARVA